MASRIFLVAILLTVSVVYLSSQKSNDFKPSFKLSEETTHKIPDEQQYDFGYLEVLENRSDARSNIIQVPVYIFKSRSSDPKPDPIIYTVGGPGSTTMPSAQYMKYYKYLDDRDFILIEQRGNYYAKPHLDCPEWSQALATSLQPNYIENESDSLFEKAILSCRNRLVDEGIDLNGYTTIEIAADINDLVNILELDQYNLLTMSYSTKIAQVLLRDYPSKIRSVVMDSPLPLEVSYDEESSKNLLHAIENLLEDCSKDTLCNTAYPEIKKRFFEFLREKTSDPIMVNVINPKTKKEETFLLRGKDLVNVFSLASTTDVQNIPEEINKILNDDFSSITNQLSALFEEPGNGAGYGMRLSVWCAEEHPFNSLEVIESETNAYREIEGLSPATIAPDLCDIWAVEKAKSIENQAIKSDVPVLLINGEYDEITPPEWGSTMLQNLENSYQIIFKGWKHTPTTNWGNRCAMTVANEFFNDPTKKPSNECINNLHKFKFKINH